jgi:hypothetical protein
MGDEWQLMGDLSWQRTPVRGEICHRRPVEFGPLTHNSITSPPKYVYLLGEGEIDVEWYIRQRTLRWKTLRQGLPMSTQVSSPHFLSPRVPPLDESRSQALLSQASCGKTSIPTCPPPWDAYASRMPGKKAAEPQRDSRRRSPVLEFPQQQALLLTPPKPATKNKISLHPTSTNPAATSMDQTPSEQGKIWYDFSKGMLDQGNHLYEIPHLKRIQKLWDVLTSNGAVRVLTDPAERFYAIEDRNHHLTVLDIQGVKKNHGHVILRAQLDSPCHFADDGHTLVSIDDQSRLFICDRRDPHLNKTLLPMDRLPPHCDLTMVSMDESGHRLALVTNDNTLHIISRQNATDPWEYQDTRPNCSGAWFIRNSPFLALRDDQQRLTRVLTHRLAYAIKHMPVRGEGNGSCVAVNAQQGLAVMHYRADKTLKQPEFTLESLKTKGSPGRRRIWQAICQQLDESEPHSVQFMFSGNNSRLLIMQKKVWCLDITDTNQIFKLVDTDKRFGRKATKLPRLVYFNTTGEKATFEDNGVFLSYDFVLQKRQPRQIDGYPSDLDHEHDEDPSAAQVVTTRPKVQSETHATCPTGADDVFTVAPKVVVPLSWFQRLVYPAVAFNMWFGRKLNKLVYSVWLAGVAIARSLRIFRHLAT